MSKSPILVALEGALGDICVVTGQLSLIIEFSSWLDWLCFGGVC